MTSERRRQPDPDQPEEPVRPIDSHGSAAGDDGDEPTAPTRPTARPRQNRAGPAQPTESAPDAAGSDGEADHGSTVEGGEPRPAPDDPRESAYGLLQRGHDLMRSRHHAQAATVLARAARLEPRKGSILEALGRAYYNSGQHQSAADTFELLLEVDPSAHYAHYALGQSLKQLARPKEARTHLRLAVALSPNSRLYQAALDRLGPIPERDR